MIQSLNKFQGRNCFDPSLQWNAVLDDFSTIKDLDAWLAFYQSRIILLSLNLLLVIAGIIFYSIKKEDRNLISFLRSLGLQHLNQTTLGESDFVQVAHQDNPPNLNTDDSFQDEFQNTRDATSLHPS
eukprot:TRINITY_DN12945_c0_g2_i1.p1 TRINITY_DN12945_c0_g2~~TRINITY_DN12945_c0_g2_i1.p1  ORF type:complete len:127 (+),score=23.12 TRINITY_DN12945_c0_g2_i1:214-594(+)